MMAILPGVGRSVGRVSGPVPTCPDGSGEPSHNRELKVDGAPGTHATH
jgi:hypothetical protein